MSLVQFLRILAARKAIILAVLIACFVAATITASLLPKRYEAQTRVLIDVTKPDALMAQVSQQSMGAYIATQLKLIRDVQTAGVVVDNLGWATDPANQAAFEAAGRPGGDIREWLAQQIVDNTDAQFAESSSIIEIRYRANDPAQAQAIAQAIREAFLKQNRDQRIAMATRSAATFEEQAKRAAADIARAEEERTQYAKANGILVQPGGGDLESAKLAALSSATVAPTAGQLVPGAAGNPQVAMLKQQIAQAQETLGPNHPALQALQRQLAAMQSQGGGGATMIGGTTKAQIESAYQRQKAVVQAQADKMDRINQMQTDIAVKREQYQRLASKAEEMKTIAQAGDTNLEPLGNTTLPDKAVWPNKPAIIAASIGIGLALGILLALLVELVARRVRSEEDLEYATGVPVLATVGQPRSENSLSARLLRIVDRSGGARGETLAEA